MEIDERLHPFILFFQEGFFIMNEERTIQYGNWDDYDRMGINTFKCNKCGRFSGKMLRRRVINRDGEEHMEYKIQCMICERTSGVHRTANLTAIDWRGRNPDPEPYLPHRNRKPQKAE